MATVKKDLYRIIRDYGEDKFAKNIAKHIVKARQEAPIDTTGELAEVVKKGHSDENTGSRRTSCETYLSGNPH